MRRGSVIGQNEQIALGGKTRATKLRLCIIAHELSLG
jgi:hypothetical protein